MEEQGRSKGGAVEEHPSSADYTVSHGEKSKQ